MKSVEVSDIKCVCITLKNPVVVPSSFNFRAEMGEQSVSFSSQLASIVNHLRSALDVTMSFATSIIISCKSSNNATVRINN